MSKRKKKHKQHSDEYILIEGHKLNEKTGKLEPYSKKVYWNRHGRCASHSPTTWSDDHGKAKSS